MSGMSSPESQKSWRFVTSHTQVLLCLQQNPSARLRDIATTVGITERAAQRIVTDLVDAGYVNRDRIGRRNQYTLNRDIAMRHPSQFDHESVSSSTFSGSPSQTRDRPTET